MTNATEEVSRAKKDILYAYVEPVDFLVHCTYLDITGKDIPFSESPTILAERVQNGVAHVKERLEDCIDYPDASSFVDLGLRILDRLSVATEKIKETEELGGQEYLKYVKLINETISDLKSGRVLVARYME